MGVLSDLLEWNRIDPPDEWEIHRNNLLYENYTSNRNPFIDFPEWAEIAWGNKSGTSYAKPQTDALNVITGGETVNVTGVSLNHTELAIDKFENPNATLIATVAPDNATNKSVSWTSSDPDVATVSANGVVTALAIGTSTITVTTTDGGFTASCLVTVTDTQPIVTSVTLNQTSAELDVNRVDQIQLIATVNGLYNPSSKVNWSSDDEEVAVVSDNGQVTALAVGTAKITATSNYDNTKSATCEITVIDSRIVTDQITYSKLGFTAGDSGYTTKTGVKDSTDARYSVHSYKNNSNYIQLKKDSPSGLISTTSIGVVTNVTIVFNTATLTTGNGRTARVYGTTSAYTDLTDLFSSETRGTELGSGKYEEGHTTFSIDVDPEDGYRNFGIVVEGGSAYFDSFSVTWKADGVHVDTTGVTLNTNATTIGMNETATLTATVAPVDATTKAVTWSTSDERIAIVDTKGRVTGISPGQATITVDTAEGHFQAECVVTVNNNRKYKVPAITEGVPYKMYLQTKGYFNGGTSSDDYFGATSTEYASGVDVYFEAVSNKYRIYFFEETIKKYLVAYWSGKYNNFGIREESIFSSETPVYDWSFDANGHLVATINEVDWTLGLKSGQNFTTFALNKEEEVIRYMLFEYTAESYASDFMNKITCDENGVQAPGYANTYSWSDFKTIFNSMDANQKTIIQNGNNDEDGTLIERMISRYEYMVWKYHYEDFLDRDVIVSSGLLGSFSSTERSSNILIVMIATLTVAGVCSAIIFIKKKHN